MTVNMTIAYFVVEWGRQEDRRQVIILIIYSKLKFPSKVTFVTSSSSPTVAGARMILVHYQSISWPIRVRN
jgi:hypothetical protein